MAPYDHHHHGPADGHGHTHHGQNYYAPYTHDEHEEFLVKFKHYFDAQLNYIDDMLQTLKDYTGSKVTENSDKATENARDILMLLKTSI